MKVEKKENPHQDYDLWSQMASFAANVDSLYLALKQEKLRNEFLDREFRNLENEKSDLTNELQAIRKHLQEQNQVRQNLANELEEQISNRERTERKLKETGELSRTRMEDITALLEAEREQHQAELSRTQELAQLEIQIYREELQKLLSKYEQAKSQTAENKKQEECANCRDINQRLGAQQSFALRKQEELTEKDLKISRLEDALRLAKADIGNIRNKMRQIDRISKVRETSNVNQVTWTAEKKQTDQTGKLSQFHPTALMTDQELANHPIAIEGVPFKGGRA
jgi:chromosome segregation ATPase